MTDIRLPEEPFNFNGKTYKLRCNYNVLADLQEEFGEIPNPLDQKKTLKNFSAFLAAMLNDYADEQGWDEHWTARKVGRMIDPSNTEYVQKVIMLVVRALYRENGEKETKDSDSKN